MFRAQGYEALIGWSRGAYYSFFNHAESASLRNSSHFAAAFYQYHQLGQVVALAFAAAPSILPERFHRSVRIAVRALPYVSIPLLAMIAQINNGGYGRFAAALNRRLPVPIPTTVHPVVKKGCAFVARQGSSILKVAMLATLFVHYRLGARAYALGCTTAILYHVLASYDFIPAKVNLVINRIMTLMTLATMLYQGPMAHRIICLIQLPLFFPSIMPGVYSYIDKFMRRRWPASFPGYSLEALERPWQDRKEMTLTEIEAFLNSMTIFHRVALNPTHLTKFVLSVSPHLMRMQEYGRLTEMWDQHDWRSRVPSLLDKLLQDDEFADQFIEDIFCRGEHIEAGRKERLITNLRGHFLWINNVEPALFPHQREDAIIQLVQSHLSGATTSLLPLVSSSSSSQSSSLSSQEAKETEEEAHAPLQAVEEYTIQKVREMLTRFVESLSLQSSESHPLKENVSVLIPYFERYQSLFQHDSSNDLARQGFEVGLLTLVLSQTALQDSEKILQLCLSDPLFVDELNTPEQRYEFRIKAALYDLRLALIEQSLSQSIESIEGQFSSADQLIESSMRPLVSRGFIPQNDFSSETLSFLNLVHWEMAEQLRADLYRDYFNTLLKLDILQGEGYQNYVKSMIRGKVEQREGQSEALVRKFESVANHSSYCLNLAFKYLILYMLGVIKLNS